MNDGVVGRVVKVGIIGSGQDKFTPPQVEQVRDLIRRLLLSIPGAVVVSGHSPVGGVDIWAEAIGNELGFPLDLKVPRQHSWGGEYGYRARNLDIAQSSDEVHVIVAESYPAGYNGRKFRGCYHCHGLRPPHVKSGACWTAIQAERLGRRTVWHIVPDGVQRGSVGAGR